METYLQFGMNVPWPGLEYLLIMVTQSRLSRLIWSLLISSLLLYTLTLMSQHCEASRHNMGRMATDRPVAASMSLRDSDSDKLREFDSQKMWASDKVRQISENKMLRESSDAIERMKFTDSIATSSRNRKDRRRHLGGRQRVYCRKGSFAKHTKYPNAGMYATDCYSNNIVTDQRRVAYRRSAGGGEMSSDKTGSRSPEAETRGSRASSNGSSRLILHTMTGSRHSAVAAHVDHVSTVHVSRIQRLERLPVMTDHVTPGQAGRIDDLSRDSVIIGVLRSDEDPVMTQTVPITNSSKQFCVYTVVTQTGTQDGAGTDSDISVRLSNKDGDEIYLRGLANGHRTFERGHRDTFVLRGRPCHFDICKMVLSTDDYGLFSEWFVVSLEFSVAMLHQDGGTGPQLQGRKWEINEWLPKEDEAEELYIIRDDCNS